jgi:8-oxo-dGTP diphosphatase
MSDIDYQKSLPKKRMSAGVLFFDGNGRLLIVNPTYKQHWEIPGGVVEADESPLQACTREIHEEIGLMRRPSRLLAVDYLPTSHDKTEALAFIFYGGILAPKDIHNIQLQPTELSEYCFLPPQEAITRLNKRLQKRIGLCIDHLHENRTLYMEAQRILL